MSQFVDVFDGIVSWAKSTHIEVLHVRSTNPLMEGRVEVEERNNEETDLPAALSASSSQTLPVLERSSKSIWTVLNVTMSKRGETMLMKEIGVLGRHPQSRILGQMMTM